MTYMIVLVKTKINDNNDNKCSSSLENNISFPGKGSKKKWN